MELNKINVIAHLPRKGNDCSKRVYSKDYIAPTITTCGGGGLSQKSLYENKIRIAAHLDIKIIEEHKRLYSPLGLSPTLNVVGGGGQQPKIIQRRLR